MLFISYSLIPAIFLQGCEIKSGRGIKAYKFEATSSSRSHKTISCQPQSMCAVPKGGQKQIVWGSTYNWLRAPPLYMQVIREGLNHYNYVGIILVY